MHFQIAYHRFGPWRMFEYYQIYDNNTHIIILLERNDNNLVAINYNTITRIFLHNNLKFKTFNIILQS